MAYEFDPLIIRDNYKLRKQYPKLKYNVMFKHYNVNTRESIVTFCLAGLILVLYLNKIYIEIGSNFFSTHLKICFEGTSPYSLE